MIINPYLVTAIGGSPPNPLTIAYDADNIQISGINGDVPDNWNLEFAEDIHYVTIGTSTEVIGINAFKSESTLSGGLTIPSNVTNISFGAFSNCGVIGDIVIPNTVTTMGDEVFSMSNNEALGKPTKHVTIGVETIPYRTFYRNFNLTGVTITSDVKYIGEQAFGTTELESLYLPAVTGLGVGAFGANNSLTGVTVSSALKNVGESAFTCQNLNSFNFIEGLESIGNSSFSSAALTEVNLPDSLKTIGSSAFQSIGELTGVVIPSGVTGIEGNVFSFCGGLTGVTINCPTGSWVGTNSFLATPAATYYVTGAYYLDYIDGDTWSGAQGLAAGSEIICYGDGCPVAQTIIYDDLDAQVTGFAGDIPGNYWSVEGSPTDWQRLEIGTSLVNIGASSFLNNVNLSGALTIPSNVRDIGSSAFYETKLESLTIENGVTGIGASAFKNIEELTGNLVLPASVDFIGAQAFRSCSFESVETLGQVGTFDGGLCFAQNTSLTGAKINATTLTNSSLFSSCTNLTHVDIINANTIGFQDFANCTSLTTVYLNAVEIADQIFVNYTSITGVTLGPDVATIGARAFDGCVNLSGSLTIPSGVRNIENEAFENTKFESLTIESGVTGIGVDAFRGLSSITGDITIPSSVDIIGNGGFYGLGGDHIYIDARELVGNAFGFGTYTGVTLGPNVERIGSACFYTAGTANIQTFTNNSTNLKYIDERAFRFQDDITSFTFNEGLTGIGNLAFDGANSPLMSLTGIILPDSLRSIGSYAFNDCKKVTKLRIGSGVTSIGPGAFGELGFAAAVPNIEVEINCPTGSFVNFGYANKAFTSSKSGIYTITGTYYQDYTGTLTRDGIGIPAGSTFISGTY